MISLRPWFNVTKSLRLWPQLHLRQESSRIKNLKPFLVSFSRSMKKRSFLNSSCLLTILIWLNSISKQLQKLHGKRKTELDILSGVGMNLKVKNNTSGSLWLKRQRRRELRLWWLVYMKPSWEPSRKDYIRQTKKRYLKT